MKFLKSFFQICSFLIVCTIVGLISANIIAKPVFLTDEEIRHYTDTAKTAWYQGLASIEEYEEIDVECNLNKQEVYVFPFNNNKQSLTVNFSDDIQTITINKPIVSFWGCFFFYGILFGSIAYLLLLLLVVVIKEIVLKKFFN